MNRKLKSILVAAALASAALAATSAKALTLYESFGPYGLFAFDPAHPAVTVGYAGNATNLDLAGDHLYFQDGPTIYKANADLSGVTPLWNNVAAPTDFAFDASSGLLYESFGLYGLFAFDPTHPATTYGYAGNATNLYLAGGQVFFQDGTTIYQANADLSGVAQLWDNVAVPNDFAIGAPDAAGSAVPEPAAWVLMIAGFALAGAGLRWAPRAGAVKLS